MIENIHQRLLEAVTVAPQQFDMGAWHGENACGTTHCRAGFIVHLAGAAGKALEAFHNTPLAAQLIYQASSPIKVSPPRFYETNEVAMADIRRCAEAEQAQGGSQHRTPDEQRAEDQKQVDTAKAERIAEYEGKRAAYDAKVAALPVLLRERVEGFRAYGGDAWRWEFEPYEMACCEEAARLGERFKTGADIDTFAKLKSDQQKLVHPNMDTGHSGNTWGKALRLAWLVAEKPDLVAKDHGAMCALVGCDNYGCFAVRDKSTETV